jgi:phosphomannomutase
VIVPDLHYGRDALIGIALMLTVLARENVSLSSLRQQLPHYEMVKARLTLPAGMLPDALITRLKEHYADYPQNTDDGLKVDMPHGWLHIRKSNTEPILRLYAEAPSAQEAEELVADCKAHIENLLENALSL